MGRSDCHFLCSEHRNCFLHPSQNMLARCWTCRQLPLEKIFGFKVTSRVTWISRHRHQGSSNDDGSYLSHKSSEHFMSQFYVPELKEYGVQYLPCHPYHSFPGATHVGGMRRIDYPRAMFYQVFLNTLIIDFRSTHNLN